jgi:hypothetical protein
MSSFARVITEVGLDPSHQHEHGWLHALLVFGEATNSGMDVEANPVAEVLRRLTAAGVGTWAIERAAQILDPANLKYQRGQRF